MSLYLRSLPNDTIRVRPASDFPSIPSDMDILLPIGGSHAGVPFGVWARHLGHELRLDIARAEAEADRAALTLQTEDYQADDIPLSVRAGSQCHHCGRPLESVQATLKTVSPVLDPTFLHRSLLQLRFP